MKMKYRRLDENGDMLPCNRMYPPYENAHAVGAAIRSRLLSFQGEWWEDPDIGIPVDSIFGRNTESRKDIAVAMIRELVSETEHVSQVLEVSFVDVSASRSRSVKIEVETDFGEIVSLEV